MKSNVVTWPAPAGEPASADFELSVDGAPVFVYAARVRAEILQNDGLWTHRPDCGSERAAFALFDTRGPIEVAVRPKRAFRTARVLPARAGIVPEIRDGVIRFELKSPQHVTVLLDDTDESPLHLLVSAPETDAPDPKDPNVLYFGPGVYEVQTVKVRSGQTIYLAGGALVKAVLRPGEQGQYNEKWKVSFYSGRIFDVSDAEDVRICGRGILDARLVPHPGRNMIGVSSSRRVRLSGITLRDAANWNVCLTDSDDVTVENLRILSARLNSDGINSVNSRNVQVRRCFVRNHDDSIVAKATEAGKPCERICVEDCSIWCDWGYALGATYETRSPIRNVEFRRCNILSARHWCMGIHVSDSATVSGVSFRDIEVADPAPALRQQGARACLTTRPKLVRLAIVADVWGHDTARGHIRDVLFDGIEVDGEAFPSSEVLGADAGHLVENVEFRNVRLRGKPAVAGVTELGIATNEFVRGIR